MSKTFIAVSTLVGTAIGAGILAIPYVITKSGFSLGVANMVIIALALLITMLYLGEIVTRTKTNHQLSGYAAKYLGKKGKILMILAFAFGIYAAILAYLVAEGESLSFIFFGNIGHTLALGIAFWAFMSILVYFGIKALEEGEVIGVTLIIILIITVIIFSWNRINVANLTYLSPAHFFAPFGVILFAFLAFAAVPEVERIIGSDRKIMKKSIWIAQTIVFIVYLLFALVVVGAYGSATPEIATLALGKPFILLGILTMFTSYLSLSIALIDSFRFDFKKSKKFSWFVTIIIPLVMFILLELFNKANFTKILGIGGVISGGLTAILILFMVKKAKIHGDQEPPYTIPYSKILTTILVLIFTAGAVLEIISVVHG